jgi:PTH1 family peptidyl-tRNA hydrolase
VWLVKPQSYMNHSGQPIRGLLDYYRLSVTELLVAHDEIDLPPGTVRLKEGGGHGGHNGLRDIVRHCGADFLRLRLGVGHPGDKDEVTNYVLKRASSDVEAAIEGNIDDAMVVMPELVDGDINAAMKKLHTKVACPMSANQHCSMRLLRRKSRRRIIRFARSSLTLASYPCRIRASRSWPTS